MSPANHKKYATHKDIDKLAFLLMYNKIAGENDYVDLVSSTYIKFNEQDIKEFTAILQYFPDIDMINLRKNPNFNLEKSLPYLAMLSRLKTIKFQGNTWKVCDLNSLKALTTFELSKQQINTLGWVKNMPFLERITLGQTLYRC